ncbi:MAG: hypothetical protein JWM82_3946, partial [Myxococcales bacterium]|nr:hypothetical protein [Myxococcales bacterium]
LGGETAAHAWAAKAADALASHRGATVSFAALAAVGAGDVARLHELWFLSANRRVGDTLLRRALAPAEGLLALLRNVFLGVADGAAWRRHLGIVHRLADELRLSEATPPSGLAPLHAAARAYTTNSAS